MSDKITNMYHLLSDNGDTKAKSEGEFRGMMEDRNYRAKVYGFLKSKGVGGLGGSFSNFESAIGYGAKPKQASTQQAQSVGASQFGNAQPKQAEAPSKQPYTTVEEVEEVPQGNDKFTQWDWEENEPHYTSEVERKQKTDIYGEPMEEKPTPMRPQMSQWEQEAIAHRSSENMMGKEVKGIVDKAIEKGNKDAREEEARVREKYDWPMLGDPMTNTIGIGEIERSIARNRAKSPEKLLKGIQDDLKGNLESYLQSHAEDITRGAEASQMDVASYIDNYVVPKVFAEAEQKLYDEVKKGYMPKSDAEYVLNGFQDWVGTMIFRAVTQTPMQYTLQDEANEEYGKQASWGAEFGNTAMGFADPAFAASFGGGRVIGKGAQNLVKAGMKKATATKVGQKIASESFKRSAEYASRFGSKAASKVDELISQSSGTRLGAFARKYVKELPQEIVGQGLGMNIYGALSGSVATYGQTRDAYEAGKMAWEGLTSKEGFASGASFAVMMPLVHNVYGLSGLGWKAGDSAVKKGVMMGAKLGFEGAGIMATAGVMTVGHNLGAWLEGHDMDWTVSTYMEQTAAAAAMKYNLNTIKAVPRALDILKGLGSKKTNNPLPFRLTKDEVDEILLASGEKTLEDALYSIFPEGTRSRGNATPEEVTASQERFLGMMNNLSWDAQNKLASALTGSLTVVRPRTARFEYEGDTIREYDSDGKLLSTKKVSSKEEAEAYMTEKRIFTANGDLMSAIAEAFGRDKTEKKEEVYGIVDALAEQWGVNANTVWNIVKKAPSRRNEAERSLMKQLDKALRDYAYPNGEAHVEASRVRGEQIADEAGLTGENPRIGEVAELNAEVDGAQEMLRRSVEDKSVIWAEDYLRMKEEGMTDAQALERLMESYNETDLAVLADAVNAQAKQDGFMSKVSDNIDTAVSARMNTLTHRTGADGKTREVADDVIVMEGPNGEIVYYTGGTDGRTVTKNGKEHFFGVSMMVIDANGEPRVVSVDKYAIKERIPARTYEDMYREELGTKATDIIDPEGKLNPEMAREEVVEQPKEEIVAEEPMREEVAEEAPIEAVEEAKPEVVELPRDEQGELDYMSEMVTPDKAKAEIYDESGLTREEADMFTESRLAEAKKAREAKEAEGIAMQEGEGVQAYKKRKEQYQQELEELRRREAKWEEIRSQAEEKKTAEEVKREIEAELELKAEEERQKLSAEEESRRKPLRRLAEKRGIIALESVEDIEDAETREKAVADKGVRAFTLKGKNYVLLDRISDPKEIEQIFVHEEVIHNRLKNLLGEDHKTFFETLYDQYMTESEKAAMEDYVYMSKNPSKALKAEEFLATHYETMDVDNPGLWERVKTAIRAGLRKMGVELEFNDTDIKTLIREAYKGKKKSSVAKHVKSSREHETGERGYGQLEGYLKVRDYISPDKRTELDGIFQEELMYLSDEALAELNEKYKDDLTASELEYRKKEVTEQYDDVTAGNSTETEEAVGEARFSKSNENQRIFVSNAEKAVEGIKQEKGTPEQWLKMIEKGGGLKAGEDKWMGLSDWLKEHKGKSITKQEVLDFIRENQIQIEEVKYGEANSNPAFASLKEEYDQWLREEGSDYAWKQLTDRYGDDAEIAFWDLGGELAISNEEAAAALLGENVINSTRLDYTTEGLDNKREIALTVPTIESWNERDDIHFGDAGNGRAVAWVRFGETYSYPVIEDVQKVTEFHEPYKNFNQMDVYKPVGSFKSGDYVVHGKGRDGNMIYVAYINDKQLPVAHATLEEARNTLNEYYKEHPRKLRKAQRVLVIDEIQSKRHQEGREKGYESKEQKDADRELKEYINELTEKYGARFYTSMLPEERVRYNELSDIVNNVQRGQIPDAPFAKNWHELAMKRMLRLAAEEGYDKIAWTKGEQQAERYNLGGKVEKITARDEGNFGKVVNLHFTENAITGMETMNFSVDENGIVKSKEAAIDGKQLSDVVGKDLAEKIMSIDSNRPTTFNDVDLSVGGEGMKGFYDKMLPSFMNKYGKKWGTKVGEVELPDVEEAGRTMWSVDVTPEMKESVMEGQTMFSKAIETDIDKAFNDKLSTLNDENKDKVVFDLGRPSKILLDAGVSDKPMKLYGNKVIKKQKKHGFDISELKGLPSAIADPIAVFDNYNNDVNRSILTELHTEQGNVLAAVTLGKGMDIDVNIIRSVFGKGEENLFDWLKRGMATYINEKKTLDFLHHSDLLSEALKNQESSSDAAKVNKIGELNKLLGEKLYVRTKNFKDWFGDWEKNPEDASKAVGENGEPMTLWHETGNDFTVFNPRHEGAGTRDYLTPFGIFLKPSPSPIGVARGGEAKQMALYANIRNPIEFSDRKELDDYLRSNCEGYAQAADAIKNIDAEYGKRLDDAERIEDEAMMDIYRNHPEIWNDDAKRMEAYEKHSAESTRILEEWKGAVNRQSEALKEITDKFFRNSGHDGIVLKNDEGSFGRKTKTYIAFHPNQVKSATGNVGTFSRENDDIRFSKKRFYDGMSAEEVYDMMGEHAEWSSGPSNLIRELEKHYKGEIIGASSGARHAMREGLMPVPGGKYSGQDGEYHHIEFRGKDGETYVESVPFVPAENVAERTNTLFSKKDKTKESPDTVAGSSRRFPMHSAVPGDSVAKLSNLSETYKKIAGNRTRGFVTNLSKAIGAQENDGPSRYKTFNIGGKDVTIRISNHNSNVETFDANNEAEGVSIVISGARNTGIKGAGSAHVVEFFYPKKSLERAEGKPLVQIIDSVKELLATGEYVDKTGLAIREEVNGKSEPVAGTESMRAIESSGTMFSVKTAKTFTEMTEDAKFSVAQRIWNDKNEVYKDMREHIKKTSARTGWNQHEGVISYLKSQVGKTNEAMWQDVRNKIAEATDTEPTIVDVQMALWEEGRKGDGPMNHAERIAKRREIISSIPEAKTDNGEYVESDGAKFSVSPMGASARDWYDRQIKKASFKWEEAHVDRMASLRELQTAVGGSNVKDSENVYDRENHASSIAHAEWQKYHAQTLQPLEKEVGKIIGILGRGGKEGKQEITDYLIKKSGLERNRVLFVRDALKEMDDTQKADTLAQDFEAEREALLRTGDYYQYLTGMDAWIDANIEKAYDRNKNDYSGISVYDPQRQLKDGKLESYDEEMIIDDVLDFDSSVDTGNLWKAVRKATDFALDYSYNSGTISKDALSHMKKMFGYYVPLRGYRETTMEDVYDTYLNRDHSLSDTNVIKNAKGRHSLADDPLAYISSMANGAIVGGERNKTKQYLYRLAENNPSNLVIVSKVWMEKVTDSQGNVTWEVRTPDLSRRDLKPDEMADIINDFNNDMEAKKAKGLAKEVGNDADYPRKFREMEHENEHVVSLKVNGQRRHVYIVGNPRAAQAINGQLVDSGKNAITKPIINAMAKLTTSWSPEFILSNLQRDTLFTNANVASREGLEYWLNYTKNQAKTMSYLFGKGGKNSLMNRYLRGEQMNTPKERLFKEFMDNGGRTGFIAMQNLEEHKRELEKTLKAGGRWQATKDNLNKVLSALFSPIATMNDRAELVNRFATYRTSREMGRTIQRSITDAKNISANFNRKGAGDATSGTAGQLAGLFQGNYMFYNATIQGLSVVGKNLGKDKLTALKTVGYMGLLPTIGGALAALALMDDERYSKIPHWDRRNNICLPLEEGYLKIALPHEIRAFWGVGDILAGLVDKRLRTGEDIGTELAGSFTQLLPLNPMSVYSMLPTAIQPIYGSITNEDWSGKPIRKDNKFFEEAPKYTLAFDSTPDFMVEFTKWVHDKTREGVNTDQATDASGIGNISPADINYLVKSYLGGIYSMTAKTANFADNLMEGEVQLSKAPLLSRVAGSYSSGEADAVTNARYYRYVEEADLFGKEFSNKKNKTNPLARAELMNSPRYKRWVIIKQRSDLIKALGKRYKEAEGEERKVIGAQIAQLKSDVVEALDQIE